VFEWNSSYTLAHLSSVNAASVLCYTVMRLSEFILSNLEAILIEWEKFAKTILPKEVLDKLALRDEAEHILKTIAEEMETPQTASEQIDKSQGRGRRQEADTAAERHAGDRLRLGFNQVQLIAEYRALRATVIRLWLENSPHPDDSALKQLIRFNEGIDQAIIESIARFMKQIEDARDFALAVLVHDLRNPLNSVVTSAQILEKMTGPDQAKLDLVTSILTASGAQMGSLISNLLDFTRTRFGQPLPVKRELIDIASVCRQTVEVLATGYPERKIQLDFKGAVRGMFDPSRMSQMLSNLVANAIQHGAQSSPVTITGQLESEEIVLQIHNEGEAIPESTIPTIFDFPPRPYIGSASVNQDPHHLGLGLYITRQIVEAHGGTINVTSTVKDGTTFVVRLPCTGT
jgi:signal transduction histidine kinase